MFDLGLWILGWGFWNLEPLDSYLEKVCPFWSPTFETPFLDVSLVTKGAKVYIAFPEGFYVASLWAW